MKVFASILALACSLQLEAQKYSSSYSTNYTGDDSKNPMMPSISKNYSLTLNDICNYYTKVISLYCILTNNGTLYVQAEYCITLFNSSNVLVHGLCPYFPSNPTWYTSTTQLIPARLSLTKLTNFTCGEYNRKGFLCSKCKPGYGPAVYAFSLMCAKCNSNSVAGWTLYLFLVLFPITVFYVLIIIFNIRATAPPFTAFVLMCQTYCMIDLLYLPLKMRLSNYKSLLPLFQVVRLLCGFWNLDFFRYIIPPFCVSSHLSNIQALSLDYIHVCLLYTSPSPRDATLSRMPSSA